MSTIQGYDLHVGTSAEVTYDTLAGSWSFVVGSVSNSSAYIMQQMPAEYITDLYVTSNDLPLVMYYNSATAPAALSASTTSVGDYFAAGWNSISSSPQNFTIPQNNYFGIAVTFTNTYATITGIPDILSACFIGKTLVLMGNHRYKQIKDICRGDIILEDIKTKKTNVVARLYKKLIKVKCNKIPKNLIGNNDEIICTNHPIWCNNDNNRIFPQHIKGVQQLTLYDCFYDIQFEDEGTFYANKVKVDSLPPNATNEPLPKELYFDKSKFDSYRLTGEDDPRRNKPKMTTHATIF